VPLTLNSQVPRRVCFLGLTRCTCAERISYSIHLVATNSGLTRAHTHREFVRLTRVCSCALCILTVCEIPQVSEFGWPRRVCFLAHVSPLRSVSSQAVEVQSSYRHSQEQGVALGYRRRRDACTPGAEGQASSLALSRAPGCGVRGLPEGSRRDTGEEPGSP